MRWSRLFSRGSARRGRDARGAELKRLSLRNDPAVIYAVGDVHGHADLYRALEQRLVEDARRFNGPALLVLLGDVIDRGPRSADVIEHLITPPPDGITRVVLMGNHEDLIRRFIGDPDAAREWIGWGGAETLASYGVHGDAARGYELSGHALKAKIDSSIPQSHRDFFAELPLSLTTPSYVFAHAGGEAARSWEDQGKDDLIWSNPRALPEGAFGRTVVHGHVPVEQVEITSGRIGVDTGAYESGLLSAVRLVSGHAPHVFGQRREGPDDPAPDTLE